MHPDGGQPQHHDNPYHSKHLQIYTPGSSGMIQSSVPGYSPVEVGSSPSPPQLPKVGETRCYWALLAPNLTFIYLDPVLASHLQEQAHLIVGEPLLSFVHQDEQASARADLGSVIHGRALHGTVTRVRFARLSKVRSRMAEREIPVQWADSDRVVIDSAYMAVDITINWVASGLVLCFLHAAKSLEPEDDDPVHRTGWSNWCSTPYLSSEQIQLLIDKLVVHSPPSAPSTPPTRVFQILGNRQGRPLLMSWPPTTGSISQDLANLAEDIDVSTIVVSEAKTSCTRRHTRQRAVPSLGAEVESVYIPHGSIVFACHKIMGYIYHPDVHQAQSSHHHYPQANAHSYDTHHYQPPSMFHPTHFVPTQHPSQEQFNWNAYSNSQADWSHISVPEVSQTPYPNDYQPQRWSGQQHPGFQSNVAQPHHPTPPNYTPINRLPAPPAHSSVPLSIADHVSGLTSSPKGDDMSALRARSKSQGNAARLPAHRPIGILQCTSCQTTQSPEWRKGPSGKKELCNACGLRFARSRAKMDGNNVDRKSKAMKPKKLMRLSPSSSPHLKPITSPDRSEPSSATSLALSLHVSGFPSDHLDSVLGEALTLPSQSHVATSVGIQMYDDAPGVTSRNVYGSHQTFRTGNHDVPSHHHQTQTQPHAQPYVHQQVGSTSDPSQQHSI